MSKLLAAAFLIALAIGVQARPGPDSNYNVAVSGGGGGGYTGPGDIVAFGFWVGLRAYNAATAGTKSINLCDDLGANCTDISTNASTGKLNAGGTHGTNNCDTSGTCKIHTIYDKVSTADCVQATVASMPVFNATGGPGGNTPAAVFTRANTVTMTCGSSTGIGNTQPFSAFVLAERTGTTGSFNTVLSASGPDVLFNSAANGCGIFAGSVFVDTTHCADSAWHAIGGMYNNTTSKISIDNNLTTGGTAGTSTTASNFLLGNGTGGLLDGRMVEAGMINGDQSANFTAMSSNQHTFWGF